MAQMSDASFNASSTGAFLQIGAQSVSDKLKCHDDTIPLRFQSAATSYQITSHVLIEYGGLKSVISLSIRDCQNNMIGVALKELRLTERRQ